MHAITTVPKEDQRKALYIRMRRTPSNQNALDDRIVFRVTGGAEIIDPDQVVFLKADSNYSEIHLLSGRVVVVSRTLKQCAELFPGTFLRPHQSYLVNPRYMERYRSKEHHLLLAGEVKIPVSRTGRAAVRELLNSTGTV